MKSPLLAVIIAFMSLTVLILSTGSATSSPNQMYRDEAASESEYNVARAGSLNQISRSLPSSVPANMTRPIRSATDPLGRSARSYSTDTGLELIGHFGGSATAVAVQNSYAYVAIDRRIIIFNTSDPSQLVVVGQTSPISYSVDYLEVSGTYAVFASYNEIALLDVINLRNPVIKRIYTTTWPITAITMRGNLVFVSETQNTQTQAYGRVRVLEISAQGGLSEIGSLTGMSSIYDMAMSDNTIFLALGYGSYHSQTIQGGLAAINVVNPTQPTELAFYPSTRSGFRQLAVDSGYLYAIEDDINFAANDLYVLDISNPGTLPVVGTYTFPYIEPDVGSTTDMTFVNPQRLLFTIGNHLLFVDVSNPATPTPLGVYRASMCISHARSSAAILFAADSCQGFRIFNLEALPAWPELGHALPYSGTSAIAISGSHAYLGGFQSSLLTIVDLTDPDVPHVAGVYAGTIAESTDIQIVGNLAYLAASSGLFVFDIADSAQPQLLSQMAVSARSLAIDGHYALVADDNMPLGGVRIVDISNPHDPVQIAFYPISTDVYNRVHDVAIVDPGLAYVATDSGLIALDISNPYVPTQVLQFRWGATRIMLDGNYAYIGHKTTVRILDISYPSRPEQIGMTDWGCDRSCELYTTPTAKYIIHRTGVFDVTDPSFSRGYADLRMSCCSDLAFATRDDRLYIASTGPWGLVVRSLHNSQLPPEIGSYRSLPEVRDLTTDGDFVYATSHIFANLQQTLMEIVNIRNPYHPYPVGLHMISAGLGSGSVTDSGVATHNGYVYLSANCEMSYPLCYSGLQILDIANPAFPRPAGFLPISQGVAVDLDVVDDYLYVSTAASSLLIYDISNPLHVTEVATRPWSTYKTVLQNEHLFFLGTDSMLHVVDVSDPRNPSEISSFALSNNPNDLAVNGDYVYIAGFPRLEIIDISNPLQPTQAGTWWGYSRRVAALDGMVYFLGSLDILNVLDAREPAEPALLGQQSLFNNATQLTLRENLLWVIGREGVELFRMTGQHIAPTYSTIEVWPASLPANGVAEAGISVHVVDANLSNVQGKTVFLSSSRGGFDDLTQPISTTDRYGRATGTIRSVMPGTTVVTATVLDDGRSIASSAVVTFTAYVPPDDQLLHGINGLVDRASMSLNEIAESMVEIADDGTYFRRQISQYSAELAADVVFGMMDVVAGINDWRSIRQGVGVGLPGMKFEDGPWWRNVIKPESYQSASKLFRTDVWYLLRGYQKEKMAEELGYAGAKFFASQARDAVLDEVTKADAVSGFGQLFVYPDDGMTTTGAPNIRDSADQLARMLFAQRDYLLTYWSGAPFDYRDDLTGRYLAVQLLARQLKDEQITLANLREVHEKEPSLIAGLSDFLLRTIAKSAATAAFDGPGTIAVGGSLAVFDSYMDKRNLDEASQMYDLAISALDGAPDALRQIYGVAYSGLTRIRNGQPPDRATGAISNIHHFRLVERHRRSFIEKATWSTVQIQNTGSTQATYRIIANYLADTTRLGLPWAAMNLTEEGSITLDPGASGEVRIDYKRSNGNKGLSPRSGMCFPLSGCEPAATIHFDVLATNEAGTYLVGGTSSDWSPERQIEPSGSYLSLPTTDDMPIIDPPLRTSIQTAPWQQIYEVHLWIDNPFTTSISVLLTQTLPSTITLISAEGGDVADNNVTWEQWIEPSAISLVTFTFSYSATPGLMATLPPAMLQLADPTDGESLLFESDPATFSTNWPIHIVRATPGHLLPHTISSAGLTITNWLPTSMVNGTFTISVTDTLSNVIYVYAAPFSVGPGSIDGYNVPLPPTLGLGDYMLLYSIQVGEASLEVFRDSLRIGVTAPEFNYQSDPLEPIHPGDTLHFLLQFTNTTGITLTNAVVTASIPISTTVYPDSISDSGHLESGYIRWTVPTVAMERPIVRSFSTRVDPSTQITNTSPFLLYSEPCLAADQIMPRCDFPAWNLVINEYKIFLPLVVNHAH
jgi:uncharacterized repeat protein (TIGR01451 family)